MAASSPERRHPASEELEISSPQLKEGDNRRPQGGDVLGRVMQVFPSEGRDKEKGKILPFYLKPFC